jgi:hypothetical protein
MRKRAPIKTMACAVLAAGFLWWRPVGAQSEVKKVYVGSEACSGCHEEQYDRFEAYAKKAHSYSHILTLKKGLTDVEFRQCLECHTTGYGKPGGFRSEKETPRLKDPGCEVCHGPGSVHAQSRDPKDIKTKLTTKDCEACHNADRVEAFRYKPLMFGGAH